MPAPNRAQMLPKNSTIATTVTDAPKALQGELTKRKTRRCLHCMLPIRKRQKWHDWCSTSAIKKQVEEFDRLMRETLHQQAIVAASLPKGNHAAHATAADVPAPN